ncbi:MAG: hypothetical protein H5T86_12840, partial [Armatimonadetes bacterium]|nr:hypothetical protein [Armatimonadota bacterium]
MLRGGESYTLYTLTGCVGSATGSTAELGDLWFYDMEFAPPAPDAERTIIGICGSWNALPRVPKVESTASEVYRGVARKLLTSKGFKNPKVTLKQVIRVDLEGDGQSEVLLSATSPGLTDIGYGVPDRFPYGYSFVLLRKIVGRSVKELLLAGEFYPRGGYRGQAPCRYWVGAVLDANGDGI